MFRFSWSKRTHVHLNATVSGSFEAAATQAPMSRLTVKASDATSTTAVQHALQCAVQRAIHLTGINVIHGSMRVLT